MNEQPRKTESEGFVLQVRKIGNSIGVILPKDLLARINLREGDKLHVIEQTERTIKLSRYDPDHAETMKIARDVMREYKDTFRALAK
ncbi:MAG: AbrB/MazE/SpoVT family DNA-binding domain-containing protein [Phreatobacter sp.]